MNNKDNINNAAGAPAAPPGLVNPTKTIKIDEKDIIEMLKQAKCLEDMLRESSIKTRAAHLAKKAAKEIQEKMDKNEEEGKKYLERLKVKYKIIGEIVGMSPKTKELTIA